MVIPAIFRLSSQLDSKEFQDYCISLANEIDAAIGKNEVSANAHELALIFHHVCQRKCNDQTKAAIMVLMISVKSACQLDWFPQWETQELLALVDSMWKGFSSPENTTSSLYSPVCFIRQVMERFYPFVKLGHILVSFEAKPGSNMLAKDFHISKKMPYSPKQKIGLFVVRTDDISKSSCIIHPQEVSFLLNGKGVENRVHNSMDSGPQLPTNVTALLYPGANLLQAIGCFGGSYFIVIAFLDSIPLPDEPLLRDYVHSEVIESNSDCDIIEGPSRISLSCPISRTRIQLPVKSDVCKHLQCFDFWNYVNINRRRPSWRCPHCNQSACYTDIRVDQNMIKILNEVGHSVTDVVIYADGSWRAVAENMENVELVPETSSGTQVHKQKSCLSDFQGLSRNTHMPATGYTMLNQSSTSINEMPQLQTQSAFDRQQRFMNLPQVVDTQNSAQRQLPMTFLPTSSPQDRFATNTASLHTSMPASQSSQFQRSHVTSLGHCQGSTSLLMERWNRIYRNSTSQTQPPLVPPPLQHHHAIQNKSLSPTHHRPASSFITNPQTLAVNYERTSDQRPMQRLNPNGAVKQFTSSEFMNMTSANTANWRPQTRMRGSLMPGSTEYDHMVIRPTQPVQAQTSSASTNSL